MKGSCNCDPLIVSQMKQVSAEIAAFCNLNRSDGFVDTHSNFLLNL